MLKKLFLPTVLLTFAHTASAAPLTLSFGGGGWGGAAAASGVCVDIDNSAGGEIDSVRWGGGFRTSNPAHIGVVNPAHAEYIVGGDACWDATNTGGTYGTPAGYLSGVSGYNLDPFSEYTLSEGFVNLGTFQHLNSVVEIAIDAINYTFSLDHNGEGGPLTFTLQFQHDETTNTFPPGSPACCDDEVNISTPSLTALLQVGSDSYLFELLGFGATGAEAQRDFTFISKEEATNSSYLWAQVTPVPEPATLTMLGTGLLGLGAAARRRMRKSRG